MSLQGIEVSEQYSIGYWTLGLNFPDGPIHQQRKNHLLSLLAKFLTIVQNMAYYIYVFCDVPETALVLHFQELDLAFTAFEHYFLNYSIFYQYTETRFNPEFRIHVSFPEPRLTNEYFRLISPIGRHKISSLQFRCIQAIEEMIDTPTLGFFWYYRTVFKQHYCQLSYTWKLHIGALERPPLEE